MMAVLALDMPEDEAQLAEWLERQLCSLDLAQLTAELAVLQPPAARPAGSLAELLGEWLEPVLAGGLRLMPPDVLRRLLNHPGLLLDLQEEICQRGGRFWDRPGHLPRGLEYMVERSRRELTTLLAGAEMGDPGPADYQPATAAPRKPTQRVKRRGRRMGVLLLAGVLLAGLLVGVGLLAQGLRSLLPAPEPPPWGWNRPGALATAASAELYFGQLADSLSEWFDKRPDDSDQLETRLQELRQGFLAITVIEPGTLRPEDARWLRHNGRAWNEQVEPAWKALKRGEPPVKVRDDIDLTVGRIVRSLRERGQAPGQVNATP
jgi:hypothetical protein